MDQITNLINAIAWPLVVVCLAVLFRSSLRGLMDRDSLTVKGPGGFELSAQRRAEAATALTSAVTEKSSETITRADALERVDEIAQTVRDLGSRPRILWVDDRPSNNRYERATLEALGIDIDLSTSTDDALARIGRSVRYNVIISDMGRPGAPRAGYELLEALRGSGVTTPYIIYAGSRDPQHFDEAVSRGAEGCTNRPQELIEMVLSALRRRSPA